MNLQGVDSQFVDPYGMPHERHIRIWGSGACQAPDAALSAFRVLPQASSYQRRNRRKQQETDDVAAERAVLRIELSSAQQKLAALQGGTGAPPQI